MKTLIDGTVVSARSFYFILDFNDRNNWEIMQGLYGERKLHQLNKQQYTYLFETAIISDLRKLKSL